MHESQILLINICHLVEFAKFWPLFDETVRYTSLRENGDQVFVGCVSCSLLCVYGIWDVSGQLFFGGESERDFQCYNFSPNPKQILQLMNPHWSISYDGKETLLKPKVQVKKKTKLNITDGLKLFHLIIEIDW